MKNFLLAIFTIACVHGIAQEQKPIIELGGPDYQALKEQGLLDKVTIQKADNSDFTEPKVFPTRAVTEDCSCWIEPDSSYTLALMPNDDAFTNELELPFDFCLYGDVYDSLFINNNGNVSFEDPFATFSAVGFPSDEFKMVAPFWGDVDTRPAGGGEVWYKITETAMYVNWVEVGYYNQQTDKLNSFQLILTNGVDGVVPDGNNVSFCYRDMQWTTGSASQGVNGFGGVPATVGANKGDGNAFIQFGRFDAPGDAYDGPGNNTDPDGIDWLDNKYFPINTCSSGNNIPPLIASNNGACDTISLCQGGLFEFEVLSPEEDQNLNIEYTIGGGGEIDTVVAEGIGVTSVGIFSGINSTPGFYEIEFTATDDGEPPLQTTFTYFIEIIEDTLPPVVIIGPDMICPGTPTVLEVEEDVYEGYSWSTGSEESSTTISSAGVYTLIVENGDCPKFDDIEIGEHPVPQPVIQGEVTICSNAEDTLTVTGDFENVEWNNNPEDTEQQIIVAPGDYFVSVTNEFGCENSTSYSLAAYPLANIPSSFEACELLDMVAGSNPVLTGVWEFSNTSGDTLLFSPANSPNTTVIPLEYGIYSATFTDFCDIEYETEFSFVPVPNVLILEDTLCFGDSYVVSPITPYPEYFDWLWYDNTTDSFGSVFGHVPGDSTYSVVVSNECGQLVTQFDMHTEICEIVTFNVFTPNGDDINDVFYIESIDKFKDPVVYVYNRWGNLIFEKKNYQNNWDMDGLTDGTYYYVIQNPAQNETFTGYFTVLH